MDPSIFVPKLIKRCQSKLEKLWYLRWYEFVDKCLSAMQRASLEHGVFFQTKSNFMEVKVTKFSTSIFLASSLHLFSLPPNHLPARDFSFPPNWIPRSNSKHHRSFSLLSPSLSHSPNPNQIRCLFSSRSLPTLADLSWYILGFLGVSLPYDSPTFRCIIKVRTRLEKVQGPIWCR